MEGLRAGYGVGASRFDELIEDKNNDAEPDALRQEVTILEDNEEATIMSFVNQIFSEAIRERATDIHIEPLENDLRIRYRVDGALTEVTVPPNVRILQNSLVSRLKIMAHLDIAERRLPQDGRLNLELGGQRYDVRIATIPSVNGESVSLRLLGRERFDLDGLGMDDLLESRIRSLLALPNGIILVTGPTGCGKSSTLYTFLRELNTEERRIVTIEDPVENKLDGVVQIAVKPEINLTFAAGLRSILRGDPNVIMVGEMRDLETAEIAIRGALTGHLVFSTLHTNDAIGGISRLLDMGIEPFLIASSVRAFLAQRLVRRLCSHCRQPAGPSQHPPHYLQSVGFPVEEKHRILRPVGCRECRGTGYRGRMAIIEVCAITPEIQELVTDRAPALTLRAKAIEQGMVPMRDYGWRKVISGDTTIEEVIAVTSADHSS
jgi:general secretion pathway protein E/type IV pilus assembly protein PilB